MLVHGRFTRYNLYCYIASKEAYIVSKEAYIVSKEAYRCTTTCRMLIPITRMCSLTIECVPVL